MSTSPATLADRLDRLAAVLPPAVELPPVLHRVVSRSAAAVAARLGREPDVDELRAVCGRAGRFVMVPHALHVVMPATAVDVDHRRAGLHHDASHVPWLGRKLRFELAGEVI